MGSCAAPSAKGDDKFITTDYLQQCHPEMVEKMAARYRHAAELHWSATLAEIERVKRLYQTKIKKSK
ncbi:hypothetical protein NXZ20_26990, partial [Escherichia coli]|nr:hypothetical protein [Escherichia coli]